MKLLKIEANCGHFLTASGSYEAIDKISKDDLLRMVEVILSQDAELDEYDEAKIKNHAHQVVYKSLYDNLASLKIRKQEFKDDADRMYLPDYKRYTENKPQNGDSLDAEGRHR